MFYRGVLAREYRFYIKHDSGIQKGEKEDEKHDTTEKLCPMAEI